MQKFVKEKFGENQILHISRNVVNKIRHGIACPDECRLSPEDNMDLVYPGLSEFRDRFKEGQIPFKLTKRTHLIL